MYTTVLERPAHMCPMVRFHAGAAPETLAVAPHTGISVEVVPEGQLRGQFVVLDGGKWLAAFTCMRKWQHRFINSQSLRFVKQAATSHKTTHCHRMHACKQAGRCLRAAGGCSGKASHWR